MKKFTAAVVLCTFANFSVAQEWFMISETEDGASRLFAKSGSLNVVTNKNGVLVASGIFAITNSGQREVITAAIPVKSCAEGGGEIVFGNEKDRGRHWWTSTGERFYDLAARALCAAAISPSQERQQNRPNRNI